MKLLTAAASNAKTAKNDTHKHLSYILHLAPARLSGYNTCPMASAGCAAACLNSAGRGAFSNVQQARIRKTKLFFEQRNAFMLQLHADLDAVQRKAIKLGLKPVVRLNGTSDIDWTVVRDASGLNVFERYPDIQFYDYTKVLRRLRRLAAAPIANYHVTFSRSETNDAECVEALALGFNVAVVFGERPTKFMGAPVIDGDKHDLRFLDRAPLGTPLIVGLTAKGRAKRDITGFVVQTNCNIIAKKGA